MARNYCGRKRRDPDQAGAFCAPFASVSRGTSGLRHIVTLARAYAKVRPLWSAHSDSPESTVGSLVGRVITEQILGLKLMRDLEEYRFELFDSCQVEGFAPGL